MSIMQLKGKQATGTFSVVFRSLLPNEKVFLTCIWGREGEDFAEVCFVKLPPSKAFLLCDSFIFLFHPLDTLFVST